MANPAPVLPAPIVPNDDSPDPGETSHGMPVFARPSISAPGPLRPRLERCASLTLGVLGEEAEEWIAAYVQATTGTGTVEGFLDRVIAHSDRQVVTSIARFECALMVARAARHPTFVDGNQPRGKRIRLNPAACVVDLPGPADQVIGAIALGLAVPAYAGWPVLVAPGLPTLWRRATALEDALCTWLTRPRTTADVLARFPGAGEVLPGLVEAQAVIDID